MSNAESRELRLRIFAGPNGSGKTTIINAIRDTIVDGIKVDFGIYINADDIADALLKNNFSFFRYKIYPTKNDIISFAQSSGLLDIHFSLIRLKSMFSIRDNRINLFSLKYVQNLAQLLARFLRECMLRDRKRFSFETVLSHESNIDIMRRAKEAGYKIYLYFVSTESPEINKFRVQVRIKQQGHSVPEEKIESRYFRSLNLLFEAAEEAYQCYFFDNSIDDDPFRLVNHFKMIGG
ncbi:MAG: hypothetical protein ABIT06_06110 [Saprospiraceae bacterium]